MVNTSTASYVRTVALRLNRKEWILMANEQNLKPIRKGELGSEELKKRQSNGGKKSVQARKERKLLRQAIAERMSEEDYNTMIDNLIARAKESDKAFEVVRDTIGEKPVERVEATVDEVVVIDVLKK